MILVTLGTHPEPMDRLLMAIDELVESGEVQEEVLIQAAAYAYWPRHARAEGVRSYSWLCEQIGAADAVISHAGPGTLAVIRTLGRVPVVVARSAAANEHVDDHQLQYAARLRGQPGYHVLTDLNDLGQAIGVVRRLRADFVPPDVSLAVATLEGMMRGAR